MLRPTRLLYHVWDASNYYNQSDGEEKKKVGWPVQPITRNAMRSIKLHRGVLCCNGT